MIIDYLTQQIRLDALVGWVERSETQQTPGNVGFRSSTQPTPKLVKVLKNKGLYFYLARMIKED